MYSRVFYSVVQQTFLFPGMWNESAFARLFPQPRFRLKPRLPRPAQEHIVTLTSQVTFTARPKSIFGIHHIYRYAQIQNCAEL